MVSNELEDTVLAENFLVRDPEQYFASIYAAVEAAIFDDLKGLSVLEHLEIYSSKLVELGLLPTLSSPTHRQPTDLRPQAQAFRSP